MVKILHLPDLHCYYDTYDFQTDGESFRRLEWINATKEIVALGIREGCSVAIAPGDFFPNPRPAPIMTAMVADFFMLLEKAGMRVLGIPGNHDESNVSRFSAPELVAKYRDALSYDVYGKNCWCISTPSVIEYDDFVFCMLPYGRLGEAYFDGSLGSRVVQEKNAILSKTIRSLRNKAREKNEHARLFLVGHWTVSGGITSSEISLEKDPKLIKEEIIDLGFEAAFMGHLHRPQRLSEIPFIGYSGMIQRKDYGEENDPRGVWIYDTKTKQATWHNISVSRFVTISVNDRNVSALLDGCLPLEREEVKGAFVRVKGILSSELIHKIDRKKILECLIQYEPKRITGIILETKSERRVRDESISGTLRESDAFEKWLTVNGFKANEKRRAKLRKTAEEIFSIIH